MEEKKFKLAYFFFIGSVRLTDINKQTNKIITNTWTDKSISFFKKPNNNNKKNKKNKKTQAP